MDNFFSSTPFFTLGKLNKLYQTHLKVLDKSEKNKLFIQILNNLKLPSLIKEKEKLKNKITGSNDTNEVSKMISEYNLLIEEINLIKKKHWILFIYCSFT